MENNKYRRTLVSIQFPLYLLGGFGIGGGYGMLIAILVTVGIYPFALLLTQPPFSLMFSVSLEALPTFVDTFVGAAVVGGILGGVATVILTIIAFIVELHMLRNGEIE